MKPLSLEITEIQKELDTNLKKEEREDINGTLTKNDEINQ